MSGAFKLFNIGDRVVYPMHGAGIIESIEEKEILGSTRQYYVMNLSLGDMKIMIPLDSACQVGLRQVIEKEDVDGVVSVLKEPYCLLSKNWNHRYMLNMEKIKSGDILEVADVVKNLLHRDKEKGLSTGEKKMLESAKRILISELVLVKGVEPSMATDMLEDIFD